MEYREKVKIGFAFGLLAKHEVLREGDYISGQIEDGFLVSCVGRNRVAPPTGSGERGMSVTCRPFGLD